MDTLTVFLEIRKKGLHKLLHCINKQDDYIGAFAFINDDIESEDFISPFNHFYTDIISLGNLAINRQEALVIFVNVILAYIEKTQSKYYQRVKLFIPDNEVVNYLIEKNIAIYSERHLIEIEIVYVEPSKNKFTSELIENSFLLDNQDYKVIDEKLQFLRTLTKSTHSTKQKQIEALAKENTELTIQISKLLDLLHYYQNERRAS
jgi:hypothetical protein